MFGAPRVTRRLEEGLGKSCSGTMAKSKGSVPRTEGVITQAHLPPVALARARQNGAPELPADRNNTSSALAPSDRIFSVTDKNKPDGSAASSHLRQYSGRPYLNLPAWILYDKKRCNPVSRGISRSTIWAPASSPSHQATPADWFS